MSEHVTQLALSEVANVNCVMAREVLATDRTRQTAKQLLAGCTQLASLVSTGNIAVLFLHMPMLFLHLSYSATNTSPLWFADHRDIGGV